MAQCSGPLSPENLPGPSGLNQVEQEKEKSPQPSRSGLFDNPNEEFIAENFTESESQYGVAVSRYEDSDSDDGLDVVYGPNPPSASRIIQRPLYNQDCPSSNTSSICNRQQSGSRSWNHEGEHYSYYSSYPRVSRVHPQDYYQYEPTPPFRQRISYSVRDWNDPSQPSQREMSTSSRYDPHDPYDLGYPPILRHPNRPRHRRHIESVPPPPRIPYHTRPPVEIDMDYLDYDQPLVPPNSLAEGIRRPGTDPDLDIAGIRNIRHDQQRQVIMRNASTSTPPIPSLRQHASTSTLPVESSSRKRESLTSSDNVVPPKKVKKSDRTSTEVTEPATVEVISTDSVQQVQVEIHSDATVSVETNNEEDNSDFLLCTENIPDDEDADSGDAEMSETAEHPAPTATAETSSGTAGPSTTVVEEAVVTSVHQSNSTAKIPSKSATVKMETRTVPASEIEFVTSTLKPRSKPGSQQPSRKTSPNTSRASPVHVAAYSQEALRDLVCATLAPAAAANLIKSEKREKKERETLRTSPDPIDDPQPGPSGLQRLSVSDEPGPSGLQSQSSTNSNLEADDLQLDCLSSDTEGSSSEDVQVVKISRRKKSLKKPVEVDLTQEMTSDDDGDIVIEEVRSRPVSVPLNTADMENKPEINVKTFASVPDNVTNIQSSSRGSTPAASATNDHHYAAMNNLMIHEPSWSGGASGSNPPPYQHRDHGYVRHSSNFQMEGIRPLEEVRPHTNDEHASMESDERAEPIIDPVMNDLMVGFRPRRLRHPWHHEDSRRCDHSTPVCSTGGHCPCRHRSQSSHSSRESAYQAGSHGQHQHPHGQQQHHYTNPPPAHRASMYPSTNSNYNRMTSSTGGSGGITGTRPGSLLRAVQRMNPRHQRLYQLQQHTTEQLRRWSVRAPPPPYPSSSANSSSAPTSESSPADQQSATASSGASCSENSTVSRYQSSSSNNNQTTDAEQLTAAGGQSSETTGGQAASHRPMLSVPRVIMTSRPTLHVPQSGASILSLPRTYTYEQAHNSHSHMHPPHLPPSQSSTTQSGRSEPRMVPPPAHQPAPPRFPEEVQLPDSRRARRCPRWHIPVMGDPHPPYPHLEGETVPLDMGANHMYHPPPYHPNMIPPNAHLGNNGPVMMDPRDPLMDPAGVPLGRENLAYVGPGMFNILFQPHRMGSLEVRQKMT